MDLSGFKEQLEKACPRSRFLLNEPMCSYTTLRLGGPADLFCDLADEAELLTILHEANVQQIPVTLIGQGSNLLVLDDGIRGIVIRVGRAFADVTFDGNTVTAQSGIPMSRLAMLCAERDLAGLAFASGIPGTLGGCALMNAGAYGGEMKDIITSVQGYDEKGNAFDYSVAEMKYGYRHSRLMDGHSVITRVTMQLREGKKEDILAEMNELNSRRKEKQPLEKCSAGSTFKRPAGAFAGALIEQCGLKGFFIGGAGVSEKHAGFCINENGTAADFMALLSHIQKTVKEQTGYTLEPEVRIVGEE